MATEYREVAVALLDDPAAPARSQLDEQALIDLMESIRLVGILQPLVVIPRGDRYEVAAGHRRLIAARALNMETAPCAIVQGDEMGEAIKSHENAFRESLNAADEADYLTTLLIDVCGDDVDRLCGLVRRKREYVEGRLLLRRGDPAVFDALRASRVTIAVARELNKVRDARRRIVLLQAAIDGGATSALVARWRAEGEAIEGMLPASVDTGDGTAGAPPAPLMDRPVCFVCARDEAHWDLELLYAHRGCLRALSGGRVALDLAGLAAEDSGGRERGRSE